MVLGGTEIRNYWRCDDIMPEDGSRTRNPNQFHNLSLLRTAAIAAKRGQDGTLVARNDGLGALHDGVVPGS